jgi:Sugar transferases involved in lipopolysaccharide synthesis
MISLSFKEAVPTEESSAVSCKAAGGIYNRIVKRALDLTMALLGLLLLSPLLLGAALAVKLSSKGPVIFRQKRLGRNGKEFDFYKFRSMVVNAEKTGSGVYSGKGDPRVTRVGRILRATSIDELPQLVNILKGDMALIGPRPPLTYHPWPIEEYSEFQRHMFDVRPGITGWAQTHGRKDVEWHRRIELNVWYVEHVSFPLDLKIFFLTFFKVFTNADNANKGETLKQEQSENR